MRRLLSAFLILVLAFAMLPACCAPAKKTAAKAEIEIETKDQFILSGTLYFAQAVKRPLVVMLHSFGMRSNNWQDLPEKVRNLGYNVFVMDLRGHGKSVYDVNMKYHSRSYFKTEDWRKNPQDVLEAISYIKDNYPKIDCENIIFIGADLGANIAVLTGARLKIKPKQFVLISPLINFKGLYIPIVISGYNTTPMLIMASEADRNTIGQVEMLGRFIQSPVTRKNYPQGGTGMLLITRNKGAEADILNFLNPVSTEKPAE